MQKKAVFFKDIIIVLHRLFAKWYYNKTKVF